jgi:transposase-like protein
MTGDATMPKVSRIEVIATGSQRRWSAEEKQRLVPATARRNGLATSQLFTWCRLARSGKLAGMEPVGFAPAMIGPANHRQACGINPPSTMWDQGIAYRKGAS